VDYIEEEINTYVEKILIGIEDNTKEDIEAYTLLLNNSKLELRLKEKLIEKIDTIIDDIATIDGSNETHLLFKYSKVKQTWEKY
jgi:DNA-binding Lrp family transcriptional regulator